MRVALIVALLAAFGCQGAEQCKDWGGSAGGASWSSCGDKKQRKIDCELKPYVPNQSVKCTCTVDGVVGKTFETMDTSKLGSLESSTSIANEQCGWHVSR